MMGLYILAYQIAIFGFSVMVTPGPNNIMLLASGTNYGYRATLPHIIGVNSGFSSLILCCALGLGEVFSRYPLLQEILKFGGSAYLLYLAWRVLLAAKPHRDGDARPLKFLEAFFFQYINPKAWVLAITIIAGFTSPDMLFAQTSVILAVSLPVSFIVSSAWTLFGVAIANFLQEARNLRIFNIAMASLLVLTIYWLLVP